MPLLPVQGSVHHAWMAIGERLLEQAPELLPRAVENPDEVAAAIQQRLEPRKIRP